MWKLHLKQPGFTYIVCGLFTQDCERVQKLKEASNSKHLYRNESNKACFPNDAA